MMLINRKSASSFLRCWWTGAALTPEVHLYKLVPVAHNNSSEYVEKILKRQAKKALSYDDLNFMVALNAM